MGETVTLELPNGLAQSAHAIAAQSHRRFEDVLLEWLVAAAAEAPIHLLPDDQVLALRDLHMSDDQQEELSDLLAAQREGTLDSVGLVRLDELMQVYRKGMVRKSTALRVAVERGLQPPLQ